MVGLVAVCFVVGGGRAGVLLASACRGLLYETVQRWSTDFTAWSHLNVLYRLLIP